STVGSVTSPEEPQSWRFLLSRRWVLFFLTVIVLGYACWWLGEWQFHRLEHKKADNAIIQSNYDRSPGPVGDGPAPGRAAPDQDECRVLSATGTSDAAKTVIVRYRSNAHGDPGVDVVVPLVTSNGDSLLVDRGWLSTEADVPAPGDVPPPPS